MNNIILFGMMGSGTGTVASILVNYDYCIKHLAKPIKLNVRKYNYQSLPERLMYQKHGDNCRELFGKDVFNIYLDREIETETFTFPVVIEDGRKPDELDYWTQRGYISIGIVADSDIRRQRLIDRDGVDQVEYFLHDTERQAAECIEKCQYRLVNNYPSKRELEWAVSLLMERIRREHD